MTIKVMCECGKKLSLKDEFAGRRVKCPACQSPLKIPKIQDDSDSEFESSDAEDEAPATVRGSTSRDNRGRNAKRGKGKGGKKSGGPTSLVLGLSAGGGLIVIVLLAWLMWPGRKPAEVAAIPNKAADVQSTPAGSAPGAQANATPPGNPAATSVPIANPVAAATPKTGTPGSDASLDGDLQMLQGEWQLVEYLDGADQPKGALALARIRMAQRTNSNTLTVKGDQIIMKQGSGKAQPAKFKLDPAQQPKALDLTPLEGPGAGKTMLGVYSIEGDTLKLCLPGSETAGRPKELKPVKADKQRVMVAMRVGSAELAKVLQLKPGEAESSFDLTAWQTASAKLKAMNIFCHLVDVDIEDQLPDGLTHYVLIDIPKTSTDGTASNELWSVISSVSHVVFRTNYPSDAALKQHSTHPGLLGMSISRGSPITATGIAELKKCPNLRSLHLSGVPVSSKSVGAIAQLPHLRSLSINETPVSNEMLTTITQMRHLRYLGIRDTPISIEMLRTITQIGELESLSIDNTGITDEGAVEIAKLTKLKTLFIENSKVSDQGLQTLKSLKELKMLNVRRLSLSPQAVADFQAALPKCQILK